MNSTWAKVRLGDLAADLTTRRFFEISPEQEIVDPTIASRTHTLSVAQRSIGANVRITKRIRIEPGDLVFSRLHTQNGAFAFADREYHATGTFVPLSISKTKVNERFLFWALNVLVPTLSASDTVGRETYKTSDILGLEIPLPSLSEQKRIVTQIEFLAARTEEARALRRKATEEAEYFFYAVMKDIRQRIASDGASLSRLGDVAHVTAGGTPSRDNAAFWGGDVPWIKTGELLDGDIAKADENITAYGVENSSAKIFPPQTILIALYGQGQTRGRTGRLLIPAATNQACCAILPNAALFDSKFMQYWLRSLYLDLREESHGGAQPNWNGGMIKDLQIAIPSLPTQRKIVAYLDGMQAKMTELRQLQSAATEELSALMPSILNKLFGQHHKSS